ncbi:TonB-dependent receptor [Bacteroides fragilis]|nr:TonB-dependent receptor [Bacteroides fragilis]
MNIINTKDWPDHVRISIRRIDGYGSRFYLRSRAYHGAGSSEYKMLSYFARDNYTLMDRYLFEVNMRADASSRFHKDHRWGYFPSFSAGWSNE